ncbi:hypothetical protein, partial [Methanosarcina mazei]|uniref:hypothetical protein n=1 Tax=Methanosarcina mazei TaxID=2209 RepID=UPI001F3954DF
SKGNDGVLLSKKLSEKDFHFLGMLFQEYHVCFLDISSFQRSPETRSVDETHGLVACKIVSRNSLSASATFLLLGPDQLIKIPIVSIEYFHIFYLN